MTREELRQSVLAVRDAIPKGDRERRSELATARLKALLKQINAQYVHCYISFRSELSTRQLIPELLEQGLRVVVPVVEKLDGREFLVHTEIKGLDNLQQGRFGLEEPRERSIASLEGLDAVIVPMVAFDRQGNRLGYGKGFYDRFLSELPRTVSRIGLGFSEQELASIPVREHDEALDQIVTDSSVFDVRAGKEMSLA